MMRSHGWDRDLSKETQVKLQKEWGVSEFNALYTFYYAGFNFRSTDLQAYIGLTQIDKLDDWGKQREDNYYLYQRLIETEWKPTSYFDSLTSNFAYPVISTRRDEIVKKLQENKVEVRPMICGSMGTQPFYVKKYGRLELPNVSIIDRDGFYVPNHPKLTTDEIAFITEIINRELSK